MFARESGREDLVDPAVTVEELLQLSLVLVVVLLLVLLPLHRCSVRDGTLLALLALEVLRCHDAVEDGVLDPRVLLAVELALLAAAGAQVVLGLAVVEFPRVVVDAVPAHDALAAVLSDGKAVVVIEGVLAQQTREGLLGGGTADRQSQRLSEFL